MAFDIDRLCLVGPAGNSGGGRDFNYKTEDNHAAVDTDAYFNDAASLLAIGDIINVRVMTNLGASNEAVATYGPHIVKSISAAGVVDVSDVTVNVVTDTD